MPTKLFIHTDSEQHFFAGGQLADFAEVSRLALQKGKYLVQAKGELAGFPSVATVKLEVKPASGASIASQETGLVSGSSQNWVLTLAATIPAGGAAAIVSLRAVGAGLAAPGHLVNAGNIAIVAVSFDEIHIS
jgi:hypothetical protein